MPLLLNKCCSIRLPLLFSGTQSFSLATIILVGILLAGQIGFSSALRCYQVNPFGFKKYFKALTHFQGTQGYQLAVSFLSFHVK